MPVERIYERDVDLLLAEEFDVNPAFANHIKSLTKFAGEPATVAEFWVSKSNNLGESDLVVAYRRSDGSRFALLIEDTGAPYPHERRTLPQCVGWSSPTRSAIWLSPDPLPRGRASPPRLAMPPAALHSPPPEICLP
jgi:hypothetical protein